MAYEDYKREEQRQATIMAEAMKAAMDECAKGFETPMLNACAGALLGLEIELLASIKDGRSRKALMKTMEAQLRNGVREAVSKPSRFHVETVVIGGNN